MEFGAALRELRLLKKLSLSEASNSLKIRQIYLFAIEEGRINDLPGSAYTNGFVRAYAGYLGLDITEVMRRFANAKGKVQENENFVPPSVEQEAYFPTGRVLFIAGCMAVLVYGGWNHLNFFGRSVDGLVNLKPFENKNIQDLKNRTLEPKKFGVTGSKSAAYEIKKKVSLPKKVEETLVVKTVTQNKKEGKVLVRAKETSWIKLKLPNGRTLFSGLLRPGDIYKIPRKAGIKMITGNAGGTEIFVDGETIKQLGPIGSVRRDILMDPKALLGRNSGLR